MFLSIIFFNGQLFCEMCTPRKSIVFASQKLIHGKNAIIKSSPPNLVKEWGLAIIGVLDFGKQVHNVVSLAKVVLDIVILCLVAEFLKLILKRATLLKEAMHLTCYLHINPSSYVCE
mgnify:CR=1 FL=1